MVNRFLEPCSPPHPILFSFLCFSLEAILLFVAVDIFFCYFLRNSNVCFSQSKSRLVNILETSLSVYFIFVCCWKASSSASGGSHCLRCVFWSILHTGFPSRNACSAWFQQFLRQNLISKKIAQPQRSLVVYVSVCLVIFLVVMI